MRFAHRLVACCVVAALALSAVGCRQSPPEGSGFLASYDDLESHPQHADAFRWLKPGSDLRPYDMLLFDPVEYRPMPGSNMEGLTPEVVRKATERYRAILTKTLEPYYDIAKDAGPHVLRVRAAVTDLVPAATGHRGGVAMEVEIIDSVSGDRLGCAMDRIDGSDRGGASVPARWRAVDGAYHEWADRLLSFMNRHTTGN
jgi:hypothetical protein